MRLSLEWLKEFVDFSLTVDELNQRLTMVGLEVEGVESADGDTVFEINVTPNRSDCLSIFGIAREVSALLDIPIRMPEFHIKNEIKGCDVRVRILDPDLCHRYAGRAIKGVRIAESPEWMKKRLERSGMRSINNVVDVTNYVLLEMGHPLHAFDMDRLKGKMIRVGKAGKGRSIKTIDGIERSLSEDSLLIWDSEEPIAVAGIMGGQDSEVTDRTVNVFLESAYFLPSSIRRTSKDLGLKTESSYRFERGTDKGSLIRALDRAAYLIRELAGGEVSERVDEYPVPLKIDPVKVRNERVRRIIGVSVSDNEMKDILIRLGMDVRPERDYFIVFPPSYRNDIRTEIDIIEEIARFYGYDRIPVTVPRIPVTRERLSRRYSVISNLRDSIRKMGFTEAINYSFLNIGDLDMIGIPHDDMRRKAVPIRNPLRTEDSHLRTTLLPSLIRNLLYNLSMGNRDVRLFEISRVFIQEIPSSERTLPKERHYLGMIYYRTKLPELWKEETPGFYLFKGFVEHILNELRIANVAFERSSEPFLHPGQSADMLTDKGKIGYFGLLHPDVADKLDIKTRPDIFISEIDLDLLISLIPEAITYSAIPRYPYVERDIALVLDESTTAISVIADLRGFASDLIEEISLFDHYKGPNIPEGKKSLAFSIRYRAKDRTLTDTEIESVHNELIKYICQKTGGVIRA